MGDNRRHVFMSYIRENQILVDRLNNTLSNHGIPIWLDRNEITPGVRWKDAIRKAIGEGAFFIACFSKESVEKTRGYMNEELVLAVDELRLRPTDRAWFIPLKLNECTIPNRNINSAEMLSDIQWVDLSQDWDAGIEKLLSTLQPIYPKHVKLFDSAFESLSSQIKNVIFSKTKSGMFTIGMTGYTGVGKSTLVRVLIGLDHFEGTLDAIYDDDVTFYNWPGVARFADIPAFGYAEKTKKMAIDFVTTTVDLVLYVLSASSRIHTDDVEGVRLILDYDVPCLVIVNVFGRMNETQEERIIDYIKNSTNCPVVTLSAISNQNIDLLRALIKRIRQFYTHGTGYIK